MNDYYSGFLIPFLNLKKNVPDNPCCKEHIIININEDIKDFGKKTLPNEIKKDNPCCNKEEVEHIIISINDLQYL